MSKLATMSGPISSSLPGRSDWSVMVGGVGSLGYQLLVNHTYSWVTFLTSSVLIAVGAACGLGQARYHRYLFATFPERVCGTDADSCGSTQQEVPRPSRRCRRSSTLGVVLSLRISIAGAALIFGASAVAIIRGELDPLPAVLVPWAGFYWAKLFCWRGVVD